MDPKLSSFDCVTSWVTHRHSYEWRRRRRCSQEDESIETHRRLPSSGQALLYDRLRHLCGSRSDSVGRCAQLVQLNHYNASVGSISALGVLPLRSPNGRNFELSQTARSVTLKEPHHSRGESRHEITRPELLPSRVDCRMATSPRTSFGSLGGRLRTFSDRRW